MTTFVKFRSLPKVAALAAALFATAVLPAACSSDDDTNPSPGSGGNRGGSGNRGGTGGSEEPRGGSDPGETGGTDSAGATSGGRDGQGGSGNPTGNGDAGEGGKSSEAGGSGGDGTTTCDPLTGADGCFNCPQVDLEFLNQCTSSQCSKFENTKSRLPLLKADGSLPPLPGS